MTQDTHAPTVANAWADLLESAACPVCATEGVAVYRHGDLQLGGEGEFGQRHCRQCGGYFLSPRVRESRIGEFYPEAYLPYLANRDPGLIAAVFGLGPRRRRIVERFVRRGRVLDVGCGNGEFLRACDAGAWERYAVDVKRHLPPDAAIPFHEGAFDHAPPPFPAMDAITLWHVFEHLYHPAAALANAAALLKPEGVLFLAIPALRCLERPVFGRSWMGWDPPRHIATYSGAGIAELAGRAGFRIVDTCADPCAGGMLAMNIDWALRSLGLKTQLHRSLLARALLFPLALASVAIGLAPARVYILKRLRDDGRE